MKEKPDTRTDPVLEEYYRMKEAFAAKFNSAQELHDYLVAETKKQGTRMEISATSITAN